LTDGNRGEGEALAALEQAVGLDGENAYAHRNLGALLARTNPQKAFPHLRRAAELLPDDQQAQYGYGLCLFDAGRVDEADAVLRRAMALNEYSDTAEQCREHLLCLAQATMRDRGGGRPRMDVVMYCLAAMDRFKALSAAMRKAQRG